MCTIDNGWHNSDDWMDELEAVSTDVLVWNAIIVILWIDNWTRTNGIWMDRLWFFYRHDRIADMTPLRCAVQSMYLLWNSVRFALFLWSPTVLFQLLPFLSFHWCGYDDDYRPFRLLSFHHFQSWSAPHFLCQNVRCGSVFGFAVFVMM